MDFVTILDAVGLTAANAAEIAKGVADGAVEPEALGGVLPLSALGIVGYFIKRQLSTFDDVVKKVERLENTLIAVATKLGVEHKED